MAAFTLKGHKGFTLIELLAVMAIVAVLAGIVSVAVGGTGETSKDTQTKQDATTVDSAAADFFSAQVPAETLTTKTVSVLGQDGIRQVTSTRWPENYISNAYSTVFPQGSLPTNIGSIIFLDTDGALSDLRVRGLLQRFNAVDFDALLDGGFLPTPPDNKDRTTEGFNDYLWLLERATAAGGSSEGASRKVAVFKLVTVEKSENTDLVDLTYQRLVGNDFSDELPVASALSVTTNEDTPTAITLAGIDSDTCELTFVIDLEPANGSLSNVVDNPCAQGDPNADSASVTYTPELNFNGVDGFSYIVIDGNGDDIATVTVIINVVNDVSVSTAPIANQTVAEDAPNTLIDLSNAFIDVDIAINADVLTYTVESNNNPALVTAVPAANILVLDYSPDQNGFALITVRATDEALDFAEDTFSVTVYAVNDPPSFTAGLDQNILEDAGYQSVAWATAISRGPADESGQSLTFNLSNDNNLLFAIQPEVLPDGTLTYSPAINANGSAEVTVELQDGGGTDLGGDDTSDPQIFTITVDTVNDVPSFTVGADESIQVGDGAQLVAGWASAISHGPVNESGQLLTFNLSNDNNALFSVQPAVLLDGTLTYTPAPSATGTALVSVELQDNGGTLDGGVDTSPPQTFIIDIEVAGGLVLSSCGTLATPGATYVLVTDLITTGDCFTVIANDITLDGNGHSLVGDGVVSTPNSTASRGVFLASVTGVTVKNLEISAFNVGIYLGRNGNTVTGNFFHDNTHSGIFLANDSTTGNFITGNTFGASLPESCQEILDAKPSATGGDYTLSNNGQTLTVYCHDMAGTPIEYFTLVNTGGNFNYGQYTAGGASSGTNVRTNYTKVRIDPLTLIVNTGDQLFSTSTGSLNHSGGATVVISMPYGTAFGCNGTANGTANIDLTGTPFAVNDTFTPGGAGPLGSSTFSSNSQVVQVTGGGFCGKNGPDPTLFNPYNTRGSFSLNLAYLGPRIGVYAANSDGSNEIFNNNFVGANGVFNGNSEIHYKPLPIGGNFWSANSGCADTNANGV